MNYVLRFLLTLCLIFSLFLSGCQKHSSPSPLKRTEFILGTTVTLALYDTQDESLLDVAFERIKELEDILSMNKAGTLIDEVNAHAGDHPQVVDEKTFRLIEKGLYYGELTEGAFDITIGPLVELWHIGFEDARVPEPSEIKDTLPLIDYRKVKLDAAASTVFLPTSGMCLDLGGIAKGYVADEIAELLKEKGVQNAIINLGGNVYALGEKGEGIPFTVGVQNPFDPRGAIIGKLQLTNQSAVTSGIYERYLEVNGHKYHHLLNPQTGYPFENELAGVTIISKASIDGDALSTSVFALGLEKGLAFVNKLEDVEAIFITKDKEVIVSSHLLSSFTLTDLTFSLVPLD
ncbi:thiamine biosynthesis protein ApbE [Sporanaerobium hydrogeniformans]|uniref:Thiamine biosynthesis protein ApbE n=1 Tax=Sporanaerobium hydrogeniformans TaxID=3072179 RepID=A0AC61D9M1_9FIRM|nr:FAD:protein FMN transferase [Sporanaerobium hydrogeniformans]PHV69446.1 thiamine biosynthesis protein ApbE [Sporanaerobium hydrogeniformans]